MFFCGGPGRVAPSWRRHCAVGLNNRIRRNRIRRDERTPARVGDENILAYRVSCLHRTNTNTTIYLELRIMNLENSGKISSIDFIIRAEKELSKTRLLERIVLILQSVRSSRKIDFILTQHKLIMAVQTGARNNLYYLFINQSHYNTSE